MRVLLSSSAAVLALGLIAAAGAAETTLQWYGYAKLDLAHDAARSSHGNFAMWVSPHGDDDATRVTSMTARQTRLGVNAARADVSGNAEIDFYGVGAENKAHIQMRKAYVDAPLAGFRLRAGQDSDLISPLFPNTLNYTVCWGVGNTGYRRPQLRLYRQSGGLYGGVALTQNTSDDLNSDGVTDGDAGTPVAQARVDVRVPAGDLQATVGVSGHYGQMESPGAAADEYETWSVHGSLALKLCARARLLAEAYTGSNMGPYYGAILNDGSASGLASAGGWANLQLTPSSDLSLSMGAGLDTVDEGDLTAAGSRSRNMVVFANVQRAIAAGVTAGVEVSYWSTEYDRVQAGIEAKPTNLRLQLAVQGSL